MSSVPTPLDHACGTPSGARTAPYLLRHLSDPWFCTLSGSLMSLSLLSLLSGVLMGWEDWVAAGRGPRGVRPRSDQTVRMRWLFPQHLLSGQWARWFRSASAWAREILRAEMSEPAKLCKWQVFAGGHRIGCSPVVWPSSGGKRSAPALLRARVGSGVGQRGGPRKERRHSIGTPGVPRAHLLQEQTVHG